MMQNVVFGPICHQKFVAKLKTFDGIAVGNGHEPPAIPSRIEISGTFAVDVIRSRHRIID